MRWKIYYDAPTLGRGSGYWVVSNELGQRVDELVASPELAPENGVLVVIYEHARVGRRVLYMTDYYLYRRGLSPDPDQWTLGDETLIIGAIERGELPGVTMSGDPLLPFQVPGRGNLRVDVGLSGLITYGMTQNWPLKRGGYVSEQKMERVLIASQNDPDLPPASNWPPERVWIPQSEE